MLRSNLFFFLRIKIICILFSKRSYIRSVTLWRDPTLRRQKQRSVLSSIFVHSTDSWGLLGLFLLFWYRTSLHILIVLRHYLRHYLGLTRPHHKVLLFLIGSPCRTVSTRATALPAFYFLAAANCLVLPIISAIELSDLLCPSVNFCDLLWPFVIAVTATIAVTAAETHAAAYTHDLASLHQMRA